MGPLETGPIPSLSWLCFVASPILIVIVVIAIVMFEKLAKENYERVEAERSARGLEVKSNTGEAPVAKKERDNDHG